MATVLDPASYLFIICRNEIYNALRKNISRPQASPETLDQLPDDLLLPDRALDLKQTEETLRNAIDHLPPQQQRIFRLSREQGLGHAAIAKELGIELPTVKNHMVRALNTLRKYLTQNIF